LILLERVYIPVENFTAFTIESDLRSSSFRCLAPNASEICRANPNLIAPTSVSITVECIPSALIWDAISNVSSMAEFPCRHTFALPSEIRMKNGYASGSRLSSDCITSYPFMSPWGKRGLAACWHVLQVFPGKFNTGCGRENEFGTITLERYKSYPVPFLVSIDE